MRNICVLAVGVCCMFLVACRDTTSTLETKEARDQWIQQAHAFEVAGRTNEAIQAYESVLSVDPGNGLAALGLAMLLQEQTKNFTNMLKSAFWYQRYLESRPDAEKKSLIDKRLQIVSHHLAAAIVKSAPLVAPVQVAESPARVTPPPAPARPVMPSTYLVKNGDSLSSIAVKVYGDASKWVKIYDANREILKTSEDLRIGQTLKVP